MASLEELIQQAALAEGVPASLLQGLVRQESGGNPYAVSSVGAQGYGQLMPATARELGVTATEPIQNVYGSARYLRQQLDATGGNEHNALQAYHSGLGNVQRGRIGPVGRAYPGNVQRLAERPWDSPQVPPHVPTAAEAQSAQQFFGVQAAQLSPDGSISAPGGQMMPSYDPRRGLVERGDTALPTMDYKKQLPMPPSGASFGEQMWQMPAWAAGAERVSLSPSEAAAALSSPSMDDWRADAERREAEMFGQGRPVPTPSPGRSPAPVQPSTIGMGNVRMQQGDGRGRAPQAPPPQGAWMGDHPDGRGRSYQNPDSSSDYPQMPYEGPGATPPRGQDMPARSQAATLNPDGTIGGPDPAATAAIRYHLASPDARGMLEEQQREELRRRVMQSLEPPQQEPRHGWGSLAESFAAGGAIAGVKPYERALGMMEQGRAERTEQSRYDEQQRQGRADRSMDVLREDRLSRPQPKSTVTLPDGQVVDADDLSSILAAMENQRTLPTRQERERLDLDNLRGDVAWERDRAARDIRDATLLETHRRNMETGRNDRSEAVDADRDANRQRIAVDNLVEHIMRRDPRMDPGAAYAEAMRTLGAAPGAATPPPQPQPRAFPIGQDRVRDAMGG
jgi:hypothetical protein